MRHYLPIVLLFLLPSLVVAQETPPDSLLSDRQLRQRVGWAIDQTENAIEALQAQVDHLRLVRGALGAQIATDSVADLPGQGVYEPPSSIDATGMQDVTVELNAFLRSVPDSSLIRFPTSARYRVDGTLLLDNRHKLTIEGNGTTIVTDIAEPAAYPQGSARYPFRNRYHWSVENSTDIVLRGFVVRGPNSLGGTSEPAYSIAHEAQHAFNIVGSSGVLIEDAHISYIYGDFVYIGRNSRDVTVRGGQWSHNGRQGVAVTDAQDVLIENISMTQTRRASIDLEPNTARDTVRNVVVRNSFFGPGRLLWLAAAGAPGVMENVLMENNTLERSASVVIRPPAGSRRANFRFIGNVTSQPSGSGGPSNPRAAMNAQYVDGLVVLDNVFPVQEWREGYGLRCLDCTEVVVEPGQFPGAAEDVVLVDG